MFFLCFALQREKKMCSNNNNNSSKTWKRAAAKKARRCRRYTIATLDYDEEYLYFIPVTYVIKLKSFTFTEKEGL